MVVEIGGMESWGERETKAEAEGERWLRRDDQDDPMKEWVVQVEEMVKASADIIVEKKRSQEAERTKPDTTYEVKSCIYDRSTYPPKTLSLGPYWKGLEGMEGMEPYKHHALNTMLHRTGLRLQDCLIAMTGLVKDARACYDRDVDMSSQDFAQMLLFDACFLLHFLVGIAFDYGFKLLGYDDTKPLFPKGKIDAIRRDMIEPSNQIPFFVVSKLLEMDKGIQEVMNEGFIFDWLVRVAEETDQMNKVARLADVFWEQLIKREKVKLKDLEKTKRRQHRLHFMDVFGGSEQLPTHGQEDELRYKLIPRVTELRKAGITFRKRTNARFWDVRFTKGRLEIPKLFIDGDTYGIFRRVIAFEQLHRERHGEQVNHISSYIRFMDNLIDSAEDVDVLCENGIIEHGLDSSAAVAKWFNSIGRATHVDNGYLYGVSKEVHEYYNTRWYRWSAILKNRHCSTPWAVLSLVAAFILLALASLQTVYTVYGYYRSSS